MLFMAVLAMALAFAAPALAQSGNAQVSVDSNCTNGIIDAKAGGVEAKAPCKPPPPPPPAPAPAPKAAPPPAPVPGPAPPAPAPMLPASGGVSLIALGAGALLVGGGLLARRIIK
jgi:hypothetical protein